MTVVVAAAVVVASATVVVAVAVVAASVTVVVAAAVVVVSVTVVDVVVVVAEVRYDPDDCCRCRTGSASQSRSQADKR